MRSLFRYSFCIILIVFCFSCKEDSVDEVTPIEPEIEMPANTSIIPIPSEMIFDEDIVKIDKNILIGVSALTSNASVEIFNNLLQKLAGFSFSIGDYETSWIKVSIVNQSNLGEEGYSIDIDSSRILIQANTNKGIHFGLQTLLQMIVLNFNAETDEISFNIGTIKDIPRFEYRGFMLDVVRHFLTVDEVKKFIDMMALYKMNFFHIHLTDDQGWRIEIDSWPNLTLIGGQTEVGGGAGGYYTKEDYREIIDYCKDRHITVIPEIDMPGHIGAALSSYPELNCNGVAPPIYTETGVGISAICTDKPIAYQFMNDVIREVSEMTPGPYIHIGGDEVFLLPTWKFRRFLDSAQVVIESYGKKMIGWNESSHATLDNNDIIQFWKNDLWVEAQQAVKKGAPIIMSPWYNAYLGGYETEWNSVTDFLYSGRLATNVKQAYNWNPATYFGFLKEDVIWGVETCLWAEFTDLLSEYEYYVYPRFLGHAEIGWSLQENRNWNKYKKRLKEHQIILENMDINFYRSPLIDWE